MRIWFFCERNGKTISGRLAWIKKLNEEAIVTGPGRQDGDCADLMAADNVLVSIHK